MGPNPNNDETDDPTAPSCSSSVQPEINNKNSDNQPLNDSNNVIVSCNNSNKISEIINNYNKKPSNCDTNTLKINGGSHLRYDTYGTDEKTSKSDEIQDRIIRECNVTSDPECDEVLTVILTEKETLPSAKEISDEAARTYPKSILANNNPFASDTVNDNNKEKTKNVLRKKSVSFENDDAIKKFTGGEEIVDQENPFKPSVETTSVNYRFIKKNKLGKKSSIPAALPRTSSDNTELVKVKESDYITKEEILRQSKYVPVYIRNPDPILTYDKSIIDRLSSVESEVEDIPTPRAKKVPIPAPRKLTKLPSFTSNSFIGKKEPKKKSFLKSKGKGKYPDLADIKVRTGTDLEESLYDPNEVAINVIKFDSLLKKKKFKTEEDSDETENTNGESASNEESQVDQVDAGSQKVEIEDPTKGSYTNTVSSSEFREFLRKKGLKLVPTLTKPTTFTVQQNGHGPKALKVISEMEKSGEKKSSILRRLFHGSLFSSRKTSPKAPLPEPQQVFLKPGDSKDSAKKRLLTNKNKSSVLADNEFTKHFNSREKLKKTNSYDDDRGSSISSMLTAAEDYIDMSTPHSPKSSGARENYLDMLPSSLQKATPTRTSSDYLIQRSSEINKAKSVMLKGRSNAPRSQSTQSFKVSSRLAQPLTFENNSPSPGDGVLKPKVQRPQSGSNSKTLIPNGSVTKQKPPVPVRTTSEKQSSNKLNVPRMNRIMSLDREEIKLRSKPPQMGDRATKMSVYRSPQNQSNLEMQLNKLVQQSSPNRNIPEGPTKTSTPKNNHIIPNETATPMTKDKRVISPVISKNDKRPDIDPYLYVKLHELKRKTDEELFNKAVHSSMFPKSIDPKIMNGRTSVPLPNARENIYEIRPAPQMAQQSPQQVNENFIRNSPQRNTFTGVIRQKNVPERQVNSTNYGHMNGNVMSPNLQPPRSQSVLDCMTGSPMYGSVRYRTSSNSTPIQLRKGGTLDRKQILDQIYMFYRRSVNNTPTNISQEDQLYSRPQSMKSVNLSPNSYASVRVHQPPPEVRERSQSVQQQPLYSNRNAINAAIYAQARSISQQATINGNTDPRKSIRTSTASDNDSVFLPPRTPTYKTVPKQDPLNSNRKNFVIMESEQVTPYDVIRYRSVPNTPQNYGKINENNKNEIYAKTYDQTYATVQSKYPNQQQVNGRPPFRPSSVTPNHGQPIATYQPSTMSGRVRLGMDGRSTPLVLSSVSSQQMHQSPVKPMYVEPMYRPIVLPPQRRAIQQQHQVVMHQQQQYNNNRGSQELMKDKNLRLPVPYESDTGSEAGEVQRILYNRQNGK